jgi:hypothetical protein
MSVRGRRGEEEAQEEGDRQTEELQVFNSTFILFAAAIASSRVFSSCLFFLMIVRVFQLSCRKSQRALLLYDRSTGWQWIGS